ncbi:AraC family transcriptional regulator [Aliikangiella sp. G2MR2-5]|uniref:AraC family transcriptional regulator n=1 Tax=Aliikangiella sp. G2MR2-5 TaxID=2788943 RepID=UPI0018AB8B7B|nr:AraC family transcriptional regulator [Aliikangiella sp. G2MR2-5]
MKIDRISFLIKVLILSLLVGGAVNGEALPTEHDATANKNVGEKRETSEGEANAVEVLKKISSGLQKLKKEAVTLNSDLRKVEEKLLYPSSTKFTVFVSLKRGQFFSLESIKLKIDGQQVASHLYAEKQRQAMARGGIQKLHITNLSPGKHQVTAFFTGVGVNGRAYKLAKSLEFEKGTAGEYLEIAILDNANTQEPEFKMKRW